VVAVTATGATARATAATEVEAFSTLPLLVLVVGSLAKAGLASRLLPNKVKTKTGLVRAVSVENRDINAALGGERGG
jgi:hypothetical protein